MVPASSSLPTDRAPRAAGWAAVAGLWCLFAAIAWLTPLQGGDWRDLVRAHGLPSPLLHVVSASRTTGDLFGPVLTLWRPFHVLVSPTVIVALLFGMATHALGRLPRPQRTGDLFVLLAAGATLYVAAPQLGIVLSHRLYLASYVYGATAMLWLVAAYRLAGATPRRGAALALGAFVLAVLAGASSRQVGIVGAVLVGLLLSRRLRRGDATPAWMWTGALGGVVGVVLIWLDKPRADLGRLRLVRIDGSLNILYEYVGQNGQVVTVLALLLLVLLVRRSFGGAKVTLPGAAPLETVRRAALVWAALVVVGVVGPAWDAPAKFAPAVVLSIAVLVVVGALFEGAMQDVWLRRGLWLLVLVAYVEILAVGLPRYADAHAQDLARARVLATTPPGGLARIAPMKPVGGDFWLTGEGWANATLREEVARTLFGLGGIEFTVPFREMEPAMALELEIHDAAGVVAASSHDLTLARRDFATRAKMAGGDSELRLTHLDFPERAGRPLWAARSVGGRLLEPRAIHGGPTSEGRYYLRPDVRAPGGNAPEYWVVGGGAALPAVHTRGRLEVTPAQVGWHVLVGCDAHECWAVDAFYARP